MTIGRQGGRSVGQPLLALGLVTFAACGFLLWHGWSSSAGSGSPAVQAPQPAAPVVRRSTWRPRARNAAAFNADRSPAGVPRLRVSSGGPPGARPAGDPTRRGGAGSVAAPGESPLGRGEDPPADPALVAREERLRAEVEALRQGHPGVRLVFADCSGEGCLARVESTRPADIDRFLASARSSPQGFAIRVHERPTAMNGVLWQADLAPRLQPEPDPVSARSVR